VRNDQLATEGCDTPHHANPTSPATRVGKGALLLSRRVKATALDREVFHGTVLDKRIYTYGYVVFSLLFVGYVFNPGRGGTGLRVAVAVGIAVMLVLAWRSRRLGQIVASAHGVSAYGYVAAWHWRWSDIDHFVADYKPLPFVLRSAHKVLFVHLKDGRTKAVGAVNSRPAAPGQLSWIEAAVQRLNELATDHAGLPAPQLD
jgi:hypothetical protein